jgi:uncharacterized protein (TIGR02996 family)
VNEEAGFIAALLAEPDDRTTLLVYADWLEERNDPRGEYLHLLLSRVPNPSRLADFYQIIELGWLQLIGSPQREVGSRMQYKAPAKADDTLGLTTITAERPGALVRLTIRHRAGAPNFGWWELEVIRSDANPTAC